MYANCTILHGRQTFLLKVERSLSKPWQIGTKGSAQSGWKAHLVNWSWRNASWSKKVFVTKVLTDVFITLNPSFFGWANYLCSISEFGTMFQLYFQCLNCMRLDLYIWWLQQDDIQGAQALYGANPNYDPDSPLPGVPPTLGDLSNHANPHILPSLSLFLSLFSLLSLVLFYTKYSNNYIVFDV